MKPTTPAKMYKTKLRAGCGSKAKIKRLSFLKLWLFVSEIL